MKFVDQICLFFRLRIVFNWFLFAYSGYLSTDQTLQLWDRIIGFESLRILPGMFDIHTTHIHERKVLFTFSPVHPLLYYEWMKTYYCCGLGESPPTLCHTYNIFIIIYL